MGKYIIAGLKTEYNPVGKILTERSLKYLAKEDFDKADITIKIKDGYIEEQRKKLPHLTWDEHEYMLTTEAFYKQLIKFGGLLLHSSCVELNGNAYLFSARSGTGKSTHTHLWLKQFPKARIINDDKPALTMENGKWYAWGTPFSGKTDENINVKVPARAIVFIQRGEENKVETIDSSEAVGKFLSQTIRPFNFESANQLLTNIDLLFKSVPVFLLTCNMNEDAALTSYKEIERLINK